MLALHLVQACLVYVNTLMLQRVLDERAWVARMTEADMRALNPLVLHSAHRQGHLHRISSTTLVILNAGVRDR